ncbi:MAG: hypothetical protein IKG27_01205 [Bacilli bacterium]|nr:hypothetical protein [Bacilli bacterium]
MKKLQSVFIIFILVFISCLILINSASVIESVRYSLFIFKENVFPSLFPFFILSDLLINYGFVDFIGNIFKGFMYHFFKVNGSCSFIFFMSIISGNPASAKYVKELYLSSKINRYEATKMLCFSSFASPLFVIGMLSLFLNSKVSLFILFTHYISNIVVGFILRFYHPSFYSKGSLKMAVNEMHEKRISSSNFGNVITNSLINSINDLLLILGSITVCLVMTTIINNCFHLEGVFKCLLDGLVEMTQGLSYVNAENISLKLKASFSALFISFGGLSVHLQMVSILSDTDIKYFPFLLSRIFCSVFSFLLIFYVIG